MASIAIKQMTYLLLFITLICEAYGSCENNSREKYNSYDIIGSDYHPGKEKIFHPCSLSDYDCIRDFLAANSKCTPSAYCPDPIYLPIEKFFFPVSAMTMTPLNAKVRGLRHAKISNFFINKSTGNVVIVVTIPTFNFTSNSYFTYQRTAKEPIALNDFSSFEMDNIIITATIPKVPLLRLDLADIHVDTHNAVPRAYIGTKLFTSNDPAVKSGFDSFNKNIVTIMKEVYLFHSYVVMNSFIQQMLCNFGFDSYRNYDGFVLGKCHRQIKI